MTKGDKTYETKVAVGLDRRAPYTLEDKKTQFEAAMKVHAMFGDMSALVDRILAVRDGASAASAKVASGDPMRAQLTDLADRADTIRKKIVATKEGGAITGEERLREHMDDLYGAILSYEGRPAATLVAYTEALRRELGDVGKEFEALRKADVEKANAALKAKGMATIAVP